MRNIKVSVIIPVYNMEKYLGDALESVERQTLQEKEIICIDDGSTDSSFSIAEKYAKKYTNIEVFKQRNMGSGAARNAGIKKVRGEYVCFLDADDFYATEDVLEYLYELAKKENVNVCGGSSCDYIDGKISTRGIRKERKFVKDGYIKKEEYPGGTGYCAFIFRRKFLLNNDIFFPQYSRGQDLPFFVKAIACAGGAYCSKKLIYIYRKEHKKVEFDLNRAVDAISSVKDTFAISVKYEMYSIQRQICQELRGFHGALVYKYSYAGSPEMQKIVSEFNKIVASGNLGKDIELENDKLLLEGDEMIQYVKNNECLKIEFIEKLKNTNEVFIFGAGKIGRKAAAFLEKNQVDISAFIVSDATQNPSMLGKIPVKEISQIKKLSESYLVIIATYGYSHHEINELLEANGIYNIYPIDLRRFFLWQEKIEV